MNDSNEQISSWNDFLENMFDMVILIPRQKLSLSHLNAIATDIEFEDIVCIESLQDYTP